MWFFFWLQISWILHEGFNFIQLTSVCAFIYGVHVILKKKGILVEHFTGENTFVWFCQVPLFGTDRPQSYCHSVRRYHNQMGKSTHKNCSLQNMNLAYWKKKKGRLLVQPRSSIFDFLLVLSVSTHCSNIFIFPSHDVRKWF